MRFIIFMLTCFVCSGSLYANEEEKAEAETEYYSLDPKFVVNLQGRRSYLRVDIQLLVASGENVESIRTHNPALRHELIMLFSNYAADQLASAEQRESLRMSALEAVREALGTNINSDAVKNLFFTQFLVQ